jgi:hypothetical protein
MLMAKMDIGKLLILIGVVMVCAGLLWIVAEKIGLGRLPGDISWGGDRVTIYFPLVTCIVLSILLTLGLWLVRWWRG